MKKTLYFLIILLLPVIGWTKSEPYKGEVIFSISLLEGSFGGVHTNKTGIIIYYNDTNSRIIGYRYKHGKVVDAFGGGRRGKQLLKELSSIKISQFDFDEEIEFAKQQEKKQTGKQMQMITMDGAKYKIFYSFNGSAFTYSGWNPGGKIFYYSEYNENIRKLNDILDLFANYYGRQQFRL